MRTTGQLISCSEGARAEGQHTKPCSDCPFARKSLPEWLGGGTPEEFLGAAQGEGKMFCHVFRGAQCAGAAIFRRNILKLPKERGCLRLDQDRQKVFATPDEFISHHSVEA